MTIGNQIQFEKALYETNPEHPSLLHTKNEPNSARSSCSSEVSGRVLR